MEKQIQEIPTGLDEQEQEIIARAYAYVYAQRMGGMLARMQGKINSGNGNPSPSIVFRRRGLEYVGLGSDAIVYWKDVAALQGEKLEELVRAHSLWMSWAKDVKGLGPVLTGLLIAAIGDVTRVQSASGLWKSFGLHVGADGLAVKLEKGKQGVRGFPFARLVLGRLRVNFMKLGGRVEDAYYCRVYADAQTRYDAEHPDWPVGRRFGAAVRYFEKLLLAHFWEVWRECKGLSAPQPYIVQKDPIHRKIEPDAAMQPRSARK